MTGGKGQSRGRNELHKPHQSQIERAVGQRVDLPADGDGADLVAQLGKSAPGEIEHEWTMPDKGFGARVRY